MGCLRLRGQATAMDVGALVGEEGKSHEISLAAGKSRLVKYDNLVRYGLFQFFSFHTIPIR